MLVGPSGAGKTAVGTLVAQLLGGVFVDLDAEVERRAGKGVARIFDEDGEAVFRGLETSCAGTVLAGPPSVVATGGGFVELPANRAAVRASGMAVYLAVSPATAVARLGGAGGRPLLSGPSPERRLAALSARREEAYLSAEHVVDTDHATPEEVALQVASLARSHAGW